MVISVSTIALPAAALLLVVLNRKKDKETEVPVGLQCFDENGAIVVDLSDRQLIWYKDFSYTLNGVSDNPIDISVLGIDPVNTVAFLKGETQIGTETNGITRRNYRLFVTIPKAGTVRINGVERIGSSTGPTTFNISFYKFKE